MKLNCVECGFVLQETEDELKCPVCGCEYEFDKLSWLNKMFWKKQVEKDISHTPLFI